MKYSILIGILTTLILGTTITVVVIYYPYNNGPDEIDPEKFSCVITRNVPDECYLQYLFELERMNGSSVYFDTLGEETTRSFIENVSYLIESELNFLETYDPQDFLTNEWRYHNFLYEGTVIQSVNRSEFQTIYDSDYYWPYHFFYYNFTLGSYIANSTFIGQSDYTSWNITLALEQVFNENPTYMLINQTVVIGDVWAPLAGMGTSFERLILCLQDGTPIVFFSNEGLWWIS